MHFRRQVPIGRYIADFACHSARLVVEIDGSQHSEPEHVQYDAERTAFLNGRGYHVLRFINADVLRNCSDIVETIFAEAKARVAKRHGAL